jgi:hypothetical protein
VECGSGVSGAKNVYCSLEQSILVCMFLPTCITCSSVYTKCKNRKTIGLTLKTFEMFLRAHSLLICTRLAIKIFFSPGSPYHPIAAHNAVFVFRLVTMVSKVRRSISSLFSCLLFPVMTSCLGYVLNPFTTAYEGYVGSDEKL